MKEVGEIRDQDSNPSESTMAFALATLLLNLLVVTVLSTGLFLAYEMISKDDLYGAMLRQSLLNP